MLHARKIFPIDLRGWHWVVRRLVSEVVGRHLAILLADSNMCLPKSLAYCNGRLREDFQPSGLTGSAFGTYLQLASGWSFSMLRLNLWSARRIMVTESVVLFATVPSGPFVFLVVPFSVCTENTVPLKNIFKQLTFSAAFGSDKVLTRLCFR